MSTSGDAERLASVTKTDHVISLRAMISAQRRLDELGTARLIGEAADVVHKAQSQGQPLGKLSPEAIVMRGGVVALELSAGPSTAYSAPERLRGSSGDRRSDVFSLGAILWEALSHSALFEGTTDEAIKAAVLAGEIRPVSEINANVPAELDAICKKALARDPADRYQSCKVMAAEISAVLDDAGYPESNEDITRWIAKEFPNGAPQAKPVRSSIGASTVMGMAPLRIDEQKTQPLEKQPAPAPEKPAAVPRAEAPTATTPAPVPARVVAAAPPPVAAPAPVVARSEAPTVPATKPAAPAAKPEPVAAKPEPVAAKPGPAKPASVVPASKHDDDFNTQVDAKVLPDPGPSTLPTWATRPGGTSPPPSTTLSGAGPLLPPSILNMPPPSASPEPPRTQAGTVPPGMKLPAAPPGATINAATPPLAAPATEPSSPVPFGATTSILGSPNAAPAAPAPYTGTKTAVLGSNAIIEATNAAVSAANPPERAQHELPTPFAAKPTIKPSISQAETVATPAVTPQVPKSPVLPSTIGAPPAKFYAASVVEPSAAATVPSAGSAPAADDDFAEQPAHAAISAVSLPRRDSTGKTTGKGDVLAGWGWGTDSHDILRDEDDVVYEEDPNAKRKRLMIIVGGAVGAVLLIAVIAFALSGGGGGKKKDDLSAKKTTTEPAVDPNPAAPPTNPEPPKTEPPKAENPVTEPPKTDPAEPPKTEPPKTEQAVTELPKTEPPKTEPPKTEPPKTEPPNTEPPKPEPPKVAKVEPPPKVVKEPPVKKEPPPKVIKEPPKKRPDVAIKKPDKKPKDPSIPKPVDPYAPQPLKLDAATAYKTGLQQFAKGDSTGALTTFKASLASQPSFAPTWRGIGLVYEKLGKKSQAMTAFKRYLQLSPNAGDADQIRDRLDRLGS